MRERQIATDWFKENNMIANADKFQAIIMKGNSDMCNQYTVFRLISAAGAYSILKLLRAALIKGRL